MSELIDPTVTDGQLAKRDDSFAVLQEAGIVTGGGDLSKRAQWLIARESRGVLSVDDDYRKNLRRKALRAEWLGEPWDTKAAEAMRTLFTDVIGDRVVSLKDNTIFSGSNDGLIADGEAVLRINDDPRAVRLWQDVQGMIDAGTDVSWLGAVDVKALVGLRPAKYMGLNVDRVRGMIVNFLWGSSSTLTVRDDAMPDSNIAGKNPDRTSIWSDDYDHRKETDQEGEIRDAFFAGLKPLAQPAGIPKEYMRTGWNSAASRLGAFIHGSKDRPSDIESILKLVAERTEASLAMAGLRRETQSWDLRKRHKVPERVSRADFADGIWGKHKEISERYKGVWIEVLGVLAASASVRREEAEARQQAEIAQKWREDWDGLFSRFQDSRSSDVEMPFIHKFIGEIYTALIKLEPNDERKQALKQIANFIEDLPQMADGNTSVDALYEGLLINGGATLGLRALEDFRKKRPTLDLSTSPVI